MTGPVAQLVALTCHGKAFLKGDAVTGFFQTSSTFQFCDRVTFVAVIKRLLGKSREVILAQNPDEWFSYLKEQHALGIRLIRRAQNIPQISDRMSAGLVGGGGTWMLEVPLLKNRSELWQARWEVWNQNAPDRRIWRVTYGRVAEIT